MVNIIDGEADSSRSSRHMADFTKFHPRRATEKGHVICTRFTGGHAPEADVLEEGATGRQPYELITRERASAFHTHQHVVRPMARGTAHIAETEENLPDGSHRRGSRPWQRRLHISERAAHGDMIRHSKKPSPHHGRHPPGQCVTVGRYFERVKRMVRLFDIGLVLN
jgi:hypothetical protein